MAEPSTASFIMPEPLNVPRGPNHSRQPMPRDRFGLRRTPLARHGWTHRSVKQSVASWMLRG
jgi:hypothetical protein